MLFKITPGDAKLKTLIMGFDSCSNQEHIGKHHSFTRLSLAVVTFLLLKASAQHVLHTMCFSKTAKTLVAEK